MSLKRFICLLLALSRSLHGDLAELEIQLLRDLRCIDYPADAWRIAPTSVDGLPLLDVAIIGAGMSGISAGFALQREGITNICLYDENPDGFEGPWLTFARMKVLRSPKSLMGPALGVSNLTLRAWYEAKQGKQAWKDMRSVPVGVWMDYLTWYKKVLKLPVENQAILHSIDPADDYFTLNMTQNGEPKTVFARKVVLATGRGGFGGLEIPEAIQKLPKSFYAHSGEIIDFDRLKNKRIAIIGSGASAFDASAAALENGAFKVDLLLRRSFVPYVNKFVEFAHPGITNGFFNCTDAQRCQFLSHALENGIPPPRDALIRVQKFPNFQIIPNSSIDNFSVLDGNIIIATGQGVALYDFILLGTGFAIDGSKCEIISNFYDKILLWSDQYGKAKSKLGRFPYLGGHFEFLEKTPGEAPYLKNIHCFNYGATLSHGLLSSDIPNISIGAARLARGIASDFFNDEFENHYQALQESSYHAFEPEEFDFLP